MAPRLSKPFKIVLAVLLGLACGVGYLFYAAHERHMERHRQSRVSAAGRLHKLDTGARAYYDEHKALPANAPLTPPLGTCCKARKPPMCDPNSSLWEHPTWQALHFAEESPSAYSYAFESTTASDGLRYTVRAHGDLDCNGVVSTWEIRGTLTPDGDNGPGQMIRIDPLE